MTAADRIRQHLYDARLTPNSLGPLCSPPITGQSVRKALRGLPVGAKVARALVRRIPGVTLLELIETEPAKPRKRRGAA